MASTEAIAGSAQTHGPLRMFMSEKGKFRNPSKWGDLEISALRISFANLENAVPADPTLVIKIDTRTLDEIFKERDEHIPGCYSVNQAFATAIDALEHRDIHMDRDNFYFRIGPHAVPLWPDYYIMVHGVPAVAVNNPANVYLERQHSVSVDCRISYFVGAVEGEVDPVNVAQLIVVAQAQAKALEEGTISNNYPLTVAALWVPSDGRTIQAYYAKVPKEYLDGLMKLDEEFPVSLTVYRHTFEIKQNHTADDGPENGFANAMRFVVALLDEVKVVPDSDVVENWDTEHAGNSKQEELVDGGCLHERHSE